MEDADHEKFEVIVFRDNSRYVLNKRGLTEK
jgi:hypothetical protein